MVQSLRKFSRFGCSYYVANLLGIGSYFLLRILFLVDHSPKSGWISNSAELWYWEKRALWGLLAVFAGKYLNRTSLDALVGEMLLYVKLAAALLAYATDVRLFALLAASYLLVFILARQPVYEGDQVVQTLTPASFKQDVLGCQDPKTLWLVQFSAPWSAACAQADPTYAALSLEYGTEKFRFARLDVGRWPKVAGEYGIAVDSIAQQLPTFIMFRQNSVVARVPSAEGKWSDHKKVLRNQLVTVFDLDARLASSLQT